MTYAALIAINLAAYFTGAQFAPLNLAAAGFIAGLWAAECVNRLIERAR